VALLAVSFKHRRTEEEEEEEQYVGSIGEIMFIATAASCFFLHYIQP